MSETTQQRDLITIARENAAKAQRVLEQRLEREERGRKMVQHYHGGDGLSVPKLAEMFDCSQETVRTTLRAAGAYRAQKRVPLTAEKRAAIISQLEGGATIADVAIAHGVSASAVRKLGLEAGVVAKGPARPRRSDQDFEKLQAAEELLRQQFGANLLALGTALRAWQKAKQNGSATAPRGEEPMHDVNEPEPVMEEPAETSADAPPW